MFAHIAELATHVSDSTRVVACGGLWWNSVAEFATRDTGQFNFISHGFLLESPSPTFSRMCVRCDRCREQRENVCEGDVGHDQQRTVCDQVVGPASSFSFLHVRVSFAHRSTLLIYRRALFIYVGSLLCGNVCVPYSSDSALLLRLPHRFCCTDFDRPCVVTLLILLFADATEDALSEAITMLCDVTLTGMARVVFVHTVCIRSSVSTCR